MSPVAQISDSSLTTFRQYLNVKMDNTYSPGSFDLLATTILTTTATSVTFDTSTYAALGYKHLQIRYLARTDVADTDDILTVRFNGDTGANYTRHSLYGSGGSVVSNGATGVTYAEAGRTAAANTGTSIFSPGIIDILDPFSSTKNKTLRTTSVVMRSSPILNTLQSNLWLNTTAITSIVLNKGGTNFVSGCRFSLYGLKG